MSDSLLIGSGRPTVLARGNVLVMLLKPYATAASSMMSHSCRMSGLVGGMSTRSSSSFEGETVAERDIRVRRPATSDGGRAGEKPVTELMYDAWAIDRRGARSGVMRDVPSAKLILTGSILTNLN